MLATERFSINKLKLTYWSYDPVIDEFKKSRFNTIKESTYNQIEIQNINGISVIRPEGQNALNNLRDPVRRKSLI